MHRQIMNAKQGEIVDHIDHNGLNNQKSNLRICTQYQNMANSRNRKNKKNKYRGVYFSPENRISRTGMKSDYKRYISYITVERKFIYLGVFPYTEEGEIQAAKAYDEAAKKYHREFATLNFK